jgi:threonine-phosphate decarboxylase
MIKGHGDDLYLYGDKVRYNFSSNICDKVDHSALRKFLFEESESIAHYPEPEAYQLERRLAELADIPADCILVTNGVTEAIYLTAHAHYGAHSAIMMPTFSEYADACRANGHKVTAVSKLSDVECDLLWLCNPNNPTGTVIDKQTLSDVVAANPKTIFVIDQAYEDYTDAKLLSDREAIEAGNVILFHSMTKRFSIPGLRIGYMVAASQLLDRIKAVRSPWSVNTLAISAAEYLLDHTNEYTLPTATLLSEAQRVANELTALGVEVMPSETNFMLCRTPRATAAALKEYLVNNHGILIRDASNFEGLTAQHFRIAVQSADENDLLINAIKEWISSKI